MRLRRLRRQVAIDADRFLRRLKRLLLPSECGQVCPEVLQGPRHILAEHLGSLVGQAAADGEALLGSGERGFQPMQLGAPDTQVVERGRQIRQERVGIGFGEAAPKVDASSAASSASSPLPALP